MFKNEEGFSLLELVVAVGVAGIIAAVALPTFAGLQDKATQTSATYAASASAAEALANSTIGTSGSVNSGASSNTASSSSSSNFTSNLLTLTNSVDWYGPATFVGEYLGGESNARFGGLSWTGDGLTQIQKLAAGDTVTVVLNDEFGNYYNTYTYVLTRNDGWLIGAGIQGLPSTFMTIQSISFMTKP